MKQTARGAFARENYEEGVFHKGEGSNGKGWWDAVLSKAFGTYVYHPGLALLTQAWPGGDKASPHVIGCKGRRFVCISEADKKGTIISSSYKTLRDHSSVLTARNLYKDLASFRVQFMMQLSTNVTPAFTSNDGGVERSLVVIEWPLKFTRNPKVGTAERLIKTTLKSEKSTEDHAVQLVYILMKVDRAWRNFEDSRVSPQPVAVQVATAKFLKKEDDDQALEFLRMDTDTTAVASQATTDSQIVRAFRTYIGRQGRDALKEAREALEKHLFGVAGEGRRLYRQKGAQANYVRLSGFGGTAGEADDA